MSRMIELTAADGTRVGAYEARPAQGSPRGAVVVIQEIFGVNAHIRNVADGYAQAGYLAIAPDMFQRVQAGAQLGYEQADMAEGMRLKSAAEPCPPPACCKTSRRRSTMPRARAAARWASWAIAGVACSPGAAPACLRA
jgi:dienelactone hydrolase